MKKKFLTALLTVLAPLAAQSHAEDAAGADRVLAPDRDSGPSQAPGLELGVNRYDQELGMQVSAATHDHDAWMMITANCTGETVTISGFPVLLVPHAVIVVAPLRNGQEFRIPFGGLPYDLYLQAGALVQGNILVSAIERVDADGG